MIINKPTCTIILGVLCFVLFQSCHKETNSDDTDTGTTTNETFVPNTRDTSFSNAVVIKYDSISATVTNPFAGAGVSVAVTNGHVVVTSTITTTEVNYVLSGIVKEGSLKIYSDYKFSLILNGVSITNDNGPAINIQSGKKVTVNVLDSTSNRLIDGSAYATSSEDQKGAFFSEGQLVFTGSGALSVTGNYKHAICSDDYIYFKNGNVTVKSAVSDGVHANDYLQMDGGTLAITASGDGLECEEGYIVINSGSITVNSGDDGITASYEGTDASITPYLKIAGGTINVTTTGEKGNAIKSEGNMTIDGGTITISSADDGLKSESSVTINNGTVNITKSTEGIEAPAIVFNNGYVSVVSSDDCINGTKGNGSEANDGSLVTFAGATVKMNTSGGDGIDSNGDVVMTGGTVIVEGPPSSPEVAIDVNGTFNISGGLLIGSGPNSGNMIEATSSSSTQYTVLVKINGNISAGTLFNIQDASGNSLVTYAPARSAYYFVYSSSLLQKSATYKVYTGGSCSGTSDGGLYSGGSYSGGTLKGSLTVSGALTTVSF